MNPPCGGSWHDWGIIATPNMAEPIVLLRELDVKRAKLKFKQVEKNTEAGLRRWLECRGFTTPKIGNKNTIIRR